MASRYFNRKIVAILLLAFGIRLLGIASRPIWYDEAFSILFASKGWNAMLFGTMTTLNGNAAEEHPLGYYSVLWVWMKLFGESLIATRLFSIIAGLIVVYLVYLIALEIFDDERFARLSMLLCTFAPFQIHYAQEIRMYSFLALWLLLSTYAFQRGSKSGHWSWWLTFCVAAALAQYTHNLAAFYLLPLALLPIFHSDWRTLRAVIVAGTGALVLYAPWLLQLPAQFAKVQSAYWVERPGISDLFTLVLVYIANTPIPLGFVAVILTLVLMIMIIGVIQTVRYTRQTRTNAGLWLLYLSFAQPSLLFLFSQWRPVYIERALLPSGAIFCIWLAWVITKTGLSKIARYSLLAMLGISAVIGIHQHLTYRSEPYGPFRELNTSLQRRIEDRDVIVHSNKLSMLPAVFFERNLPHSFIADSPGSSTDTLSPITQQVLGIKEEKDIKTATQNASRVWYIIYERSIAEYRSAGYKTHPDIEYLDSQFDLETIEIWGGLQVLLYAKES